MRPKETPMILIHDSFMYGPWRVWNLEIARRILRKMFARFPRKSGQRPKKKHAAPPTKKGNTDTTFYIFPQAFALSAVIKQRCKTQWGFAEIPWIWLWQQTEAVEAVSSTDAMVGVEE